MCIIEFAIIFDSFAKTIIITIVTKSSLVSPSDCQIFNKDSIIIKDFETCLILFMFFFFSLLHPLFIFQLVSFVLVGVAAYARVVTVVTSLALVGGVISCGVFLFFTALIGLIGACRHHQVLLFFVSLETVWDRFVTFLCGNCFLFNSGALSKGDIRYRYIMIQSQSLN